MGLQKSDRITYQEMQNLVDNCRTYFTIPGVVRCSQGVVEEAKKEFESSLLETTVKYSDSNISLEEYNRLLREEIEPLRKLYLFYKERVSLPFDLPLDC